MTSPKPERWAPPNHNFEIGIDHLNGILPEPLRRPTVVTIRGKSGTYKTSIAQNFLMSGIAGCPAAGGGRQRENVLLLTLGEKTRFRGADNRWVLSEDLWQGDMPKIITSNFLALDTEQIEEKFYFRPGNLGYPVFDTAVGPIGVYICYDRHFPEGWRALGLGGARIVFNPSATSRGLSAYLWNLEQPAAAVANEYFVGAINRVGVEDLGDNDFYGSSYFVDPRGQIGGRGGVRLRGRRDRARPRHGTARPRCAARGPSTATVAPTATTSLVEP